MPDNKHLIHAHSSVVTNGQPKLPTSSRIEYGELAVNFAEGYETLSIRNSNDDIVTFSSDNAIKNIIIDNEKVIASALNDLDGKIDNSVEDLEEEMVRMTPITYSELKTLRNNSQLKPGQFYRITDYTTTTVQADTQSANHQFDIIVLATDVNTLNENAKAIKHAGDTYFADSNLNAWELKYSLDNDDTKFAWADTTNGKGVIYYMKDEWNNECPYDFKNIQFKRWKVTHESLATEDFDETYSGMKILGTEFPIGYTIEDSTDFLWMYTFTGQKIEYDPEWDVPSDIDSTMTLYDLSIINMSKLHDGTEETYGCCNNIIKEAVNTYLYPSDIRILNNIVFTGWVFDEDTIPSNVDYSDISTLMLCPCDNFIGENSSYMSFGYGCYNNRIEGMGFLNVFGKRCNNNIFGHDISMFNIGDDCYDNSIGNFQHFAVLDSRCSNNTIKDNFSGVLQKQCKFNDIGYYFVEGLLDSDCQFNTFGNYCNTVRLASYCCCNTFGNDLTFITFSKDYTNDCIVENGNQYITLTSTQTTSSSNQLRNIKIAQGVNNSNTAKTISHNTVNDEFQTVYQNANSTVVNV